MKAEEPRAENLDPKASVDAELFGTRQTILFKKTAGNVKEEEATGVRDSIENEMSKEEEQDQQQEQ